MTRVKKAFLALEPYVRDGRAGKRPRDGYYVEFWRILLRHPELLVWETFWSDSMREMQREFSSTAKSVKPGIPVGYHIWQNISFNPIYRAEQDYRPLHGVCRFSEAGDSTTIRPVSAWPRLSTASPKMYSGI